MRVFIRRSSRNKSSEKIARMISPNVSRMVVVMLLLPAMFVDVVKLPLAYDVCGSGIEFGLS